MSFFSHVSSLLKRYGTKVTISKNGVDVTTKAFIQPLRHKSYMIGDKKLAMGGYTDNRFYLYIGPAKYPFFRTENTIIESNGKRYVVHTSMEYELCGKVLYIWAVLRPHKEQRRDEYETD